MKQDWDKVAKGWESPLSGETFNQDLFKQIIREQNDLYHAMGPAWQEFARDTQNVKEFFKRQMTKVPSSYATYDNIGDFYGDLFHGPRAFASHKEFFLSRTHELDHAYIFENIPVAHALPSNPGSAYMLDPLDYCLLMELIERAGHTREAIALARYKQILHPSQPLTELQKELIYMPALAPQILAGKFLEVTQPPGRMISALHAYRDLHITAYETDLRRRLDTGTFRDVTIIKLSPDDIRSIGQRMGIDMFETKDCFVPYTAETIAVDHFQGRRLNFLIRSLGSEKRRNLCTLAEEVEAIGATPGQYLAEQLERRFVYEPPGAPQP